MVGRLACCRPLAHEVLYPWYGTVNDRIYTASPLSTFFFPWAFGPLVGKPFVHGGTVARRQRSPRSSDGRSVKDDKTLRERDLRRVRIDRNSDTMD